MLACATVFISSIVVNMDHGALPICSEEVKRKFGIGDVGFGSLGTVIYLGITIGCLQATKELSYAGNKQKLLAGSMIVNVLCLFAFTLTPNFLLNVTLRLLSGIFQAIFVIYGPVWFDAFSP